YDYASLARQHHAHGVLEGVVQASVQPLKGADFGREGAMGRGECTAIGSRGCFIHWSILNVAGWLATLLQDYGTVVAGFLSHALCGGRAQSCKLLSVTMPWPVCSRPQPRVRRHALLRIFLFGDLHAY